MRHLMKILRFGWPYLARYWRRFVLGVLLGMLFAAANGLLLGAIKTVLDRMSPPPIVQTVDATVASEKPDKSRLAALKQHFKGITDPLKKTYHEQAEHWLPRIGQKPNSRQIIGVLLIFPLLAIIRGFTGYLSSYCLAWVSERVVNDLRVDVLKKLNSLSLDFFNRSTMGDLLMRVSGDASALQRCLSLGLSDLIKEPLTVMFIIGSLFLIDPKLTIMAPILFPAMIIPIIYFGRKVRKASRSGLKKNISQSSLLVETLSGIRIIKAFNLEGPQLERFRRNSEDLVHYALRAVRAKELINPVIETVSTLGFGAILIYIVTHGIQLKDMVTVLAGAAFIYTPIKKLAAIHVLLQQTEAAVTRLMGIMAEQPSVKEPVNPVPLPKFANTITLENIGFAYKEQPVLQGVSLSIRRGQRVGIAGESGSGKSTLLNLLFRFYDPTSGSIKIDGVDIRSVTMHDLRAQMALVSQEIVLFDLTVAGNIACGRPGATQVEIEAAAKSAYAHDFIMRLPQGYETSIGERGITLSVGQRQRLSIARAFVRNAPILVLDEATASLDSQAEAEVQAAIELLEQNRTVICVAHRLSTLANMDQIIVLSREGRIVESGSMKELIARQGLFADMARRQGIH